MPKITNRKSGKVYPATKEQVDAIKGNDLTKDLYDVEETEVPAEVKKLQEQNAGASVAKEETPSDTSGSTDSDEGKGKAKSRKAQADTAASTDSPK